MKSAKIAIGVALQAVGYFAGIMLILGLLLFGVPATVGDIAAAAGLLAGAVVGVVVGRLLIDVARADHI